MQDYIVQTRQKMLQCWRAAELYTRCSIVAMIIGSHGTKISACCTACLAVYNICRTWSHNAAQVFAHCNSAVDFSRICSEASFSVIFLYVIFPDDVCTLCSNAELFQVLDVVTGLGSK